MLQYYGQLVKDGLVASQQTNNQWTLGQLATLGVDPGTVMPVTPTVYAQGGISNANITGANLVGGNDVRLTFRVGTNVTAKVFGSTSPGGPFTTYVGEFDTGPTASSNQFTDTTGVARPGAQFYYKLISVADGVVSSATAAVYGEIEQARASGPYVYWVGVPVAYPAGSNNLNSLLGQDLSRGLTGGGTPTGSDCIDVYTSTGESSFFVNSSGEVCSNSFPYGQASLLVQQGDGIVITKVSPGSGTCVFVGQTMTNGSASLTVRPQWNVFSWPFTIPTNLAAWGSALANACHGDNIDTNSDAIYLDNRSGQVSGRSEPLVKLRLWADGTWRYVYGSQDASALQLQSGAGVFLRHRTNDTNTWNVVNPVQ
jgi:hypothetical protein